VCLLEDAIEVEQRAILVADVSQSARSSVVEAINPPNPALKICFIDFASAILVHAKLMLAP
jgi:hypothetical protein